MSDNFRDLCAGLADALDNSHQRLTGDPSFTHPLADRARAALAEGEAVGPTYREVLALRDELDTNGLGTVDLVAFARAVLARYGAAPRPIPVAERLPGAEDCAPWPDDPDLTHWCWVGMDVDGGWVWEQRLAVVLTLFCDDFTHWLPAHALPIPTPENTND